MWKDFDRWNEKKQKIERTERQIFFHEREIWWCSLGLNIGSEQNGANEKFERPVLILKKFNEYVLWILPITSVKKSNKFMCPVDSKENSSSVIFSQIRLISSKRLTRKIKTIEKEKFNEIIRSLIRLFPKKY